MKNKTSTILKQNDRMYLKALVYIYFIYISTQILRYFSNTWYKYV